MIEPAPTTTRGTRRLPFLPPNEAMGWTPYAWLIYLPTFVLEPLLAHRPAWQLVATVLATVAFLATYFRGYWLYGNRILGVIAAQVALGIVTTPINGNSAVMFIYASAFACRMERARSGVWVIACVWAA